MKKMKVIINWVVNFGLSGILIAFLLIAPISLMPNLLSAQANINNVKNYSYQGILELWHVETFEGGSVSREIFLERQALEFERKHKGTYVVIQKMDLEQFNLNIKNGKKPNMLSFGMGVGDNFVEQLITIEESSNVRSDLLIGGKLNSKQLAIPYILGGYAIIGNKQQNGEISGVTGVGLNGYVNPLEAVKKNNLKITKAKETNLDSYTAYDKYIKGYYDNLLGTQRDVFRIWNKQQKGILNNIEFNFLSGYSDLVQYISIFSSSEVEENLCKEFLKNLVDNETQFQLSNYNMFSVNNRLKLYSDDVYSKMEKALNDNLKTSNVFKNINLIIDEIKNSDI